MGDMVKIEDRGGELLLSLRKEELEPFCFEDLETIEDSFRTLFIRLEEYYHISIEGFYLIHVYFDEEVGMVLKLEKEDLEYYPFHQVEMRIVKEDVKFLYQVEDVTDLFGKEVEIYFYHNQFYVRGKGEKIEYFLSEMGKLVYEDTDLIMKNGILLQEV